MISVRVMNEFGRLHEVILCEPRGVRIGRPINAVQRHFFQSDPPDLAAIRPAYRAWIEILEAAGVRLRWITPDSSLPSQMYTRDVGFAIGDRFFVGTMAQAVRQPETAAFLELLRREGISYERISTGTIEGGDILVNSPQVFVGIGERSRAGAVKELARRLGPGWEVVPIHLARGVLHLDCVMTIIGPGSLIWCPPLVADQHGVIQSQFPERIVVTEEQVLNMAANVLMLSPTVACVERRQQGLKEALRQRGFTVHTVDWAEIRKLGGLFRCATSPLMRGE